MISKTYLIFAALFASSLLSGCATMTDRSRHQYVYIQSQPEGAKIIDDGQLLGTTPAIVRLHRAKGYLLELQEGHEKKELSLETKYSWNESFFRGLIFTSYAPIAWLTDVLSGDSWTYLDPEPVEFGRARGEKPPPPVVKAIAIAPPLANSVKLSDEAAEYWSQQLPHLYPHARILDYHDNLKVFQEYGFEFDGQTSDIQEQRELFDELKASTIFVSKVDESAEGVNLEGDLLDPLGQHSETHRKVGTKPLPTEYVNRSWYERHYDWIQIVPNTIGIELSNSNVELNSNNTTYMSANTGSNSDFINSLSYLQSIAISRLQPPRMDGSSRWRFQLVPGGTLSYKHIFFPEFSNLADVEFKFLQVGIGFGPEVGWQSGRHYIFWQLIPIMAWSQIQWQNPLNGSQQTMSEGVLSLVSQLGYLFFINEHFSIRLFTKGTSASPALWNSVISRINPVAPEVTSPQEVSVGVAFGYTFDTHHHLTH